MKPLVQHLTDVVNDDVRLGTRPLGVALRYLQLQPLIKLMDDLLEEIDAYEAGAYSATYFATCIDRIYSQRAIIETYDEGWQQAMDYEQSKFGEAAQEDSISEPGT